MEQQLLEKLENLKAEKLAIEGKAQERINIEVESYRRSLQVEVQVTLNMLSRQIKEYEDLLGITVEDKEE